MLGGDGADELLAGYPTFAAERAAGLFRRLPRAGAGAGRRGGRAAAGRSPQLQLRLQAQAVPPRRGRAASAGPPALARLVLRRRDRPAAGRRRPDRRRGRAPPPRRVARRRRRPAVPLAGSVPGHLPARGHPDQGRPGEHGLRPGGPGPVPRRRAGRLHPVPAAVLQVRPEPDQAVAQAGRGEPAAGLDPGSPQEGLRHPGRPLAPRAAGPLAERASGPRAARAPGDLSTPTRSPAASPSISRASRDHRKPLWTLLMFQLWYDHWLRSVG